ncbi:MAG: hypothetical protein ABI780_03060 [Ardenticatenales bacterium]
MPIPRSIARRTAAVAFACLSLVSATRASPSPAAARVVAAGTRPIVSADERWISPPAFLALEDDAVFFVDGTQLVAGRIEDPADGWFEVGRSAPVPAPDAEPDALEVSANVAWLAWSAGDVHRLSVYDVASAAGRAGGADAAGDDPALLTSAPLPCRPARLRAAESRAIVQCADASSDASLLLIDLTTAPSFQLAVTALTDLPPSVTAFDWRDGRLAIVDRPAEGWPRLTWYAALDPRQPHVRGQIEIQTRIASDVLLAGAYALVRHSPISAVADLNAFDLGDPAGARQTGTWRLSPTGGVDVAVLDAHTVVATDAYRRRWWSIDLSAPAAQAESDLLDLPECPGRVGGQMSLSARDGRVLVLDGCRQYVVESPVGASDGADVPIVTRLTDHPVPDRAPAGPIGAVGGAVVASTYAGLVVAQPQPDGRVDAAGALDVSDGVGIAGHVFVQRLAVAGERVWVGLVGLTNVPVRAVEMGGAGGPQWLPGAEIGAADDDVKALAVAGHLLAIATDPLTQSGTQLYDIADPTHPRRLSQLRSDGPRVVYAVDDIAISGARVAAVVGGDLHVWRIDDPTAPVWLGAVPTTAVRLGATDNGVVFATTATGIEVYDVSGQGPARAIGALADLEPPPGASAVDVGIAVTAVSGAPIVAYRSGAQRVHFIDVSDPARPREFAVRQVPDATPGRNADALLAGPVVDAAGGDVWAAGWRRWYRWSLGTVAVAGRVVLPWLGRGGER